jgi:HK97 family phage portal protein
MANPILSWLRGDDLKREPARAVQPVEERKLYYYDDGLTPAMASDPNISQAIRLGMLVHGPGASEMIYRAWHHEDSNSAVFACLSAIATAYPEAPAKVFREKAPGEQPEWQPDSPLQELLDSPIPEMKLTRELLWHYTQWCKHVNGNAYWRKVRSGVGLPVRLVPLSPLQVRPVTTKTDAARGVFISYFAYTYDASKDPEAIPVQDMVHFKLGIDDKDPRLGCSPLAHLVREVAGDEEAHRWQTSMLANGGAAGMMVELPQGSTLTEEQADRMKADIAQRFGGNNRGAVGILQDGGVMKPYGFSPSDMDMKALHRIPEERIAAVLRVPAIIAGLGAGLDRSTYANFAEAREMFAEMTILPLYVFDAATLNLDLTPEFTSDKRVRISFDITDLRALQEDEDAKYKRLDLGVVHGWIGKSEARTDVGLPPQMPPEDEQQPMQLPPDQQPQDGNQDTPANAKMRELKSQIDLEQMPAVLQALVDLATPATQKDLERYLDGQRRRVKRALVG